MSNLTTVSTLAFSKAGKPNRLTIGPATAWGVIHKGRKSRRWGFSPNLLRLSPVGRTGAQLSEPPSMRLLQCSGRTSHSPLRRSFSNLPATGPQFGVKAVEPFGRHLQGGHYYCPKSLFRSGFAPSHSRSSNGLHLCALIAIASTWGLPMNSFGNQRRKTSSVWVWQTPQLWTRIE